MTTFEAAATVSPLTRQHEAGPSSRPDDGFHRCPHEGCDKSYAKASKLAQHIRSHTGERPFVCEHPGCGASYMRNEHLKAHQRRHQDPSEKPFSCQEEGCDLQFWTSSQLKNHVQACHADHMSSVTGASAQDYPCTEPGCDLTLHKRKQLRQHIRDHHGDSSIPRQSNSVESRGAEGSPSGTELPFACQWPGCEKRFPTNSKRKAHYRTHEDGRYTCSMEHTHPQPGSHEIQPPYVYKFPTWSALQAHMKEAHPPTCPWPGCGKQFQRQDNLRAHYRRHESRKLRLELEAKVLEGSHESGLNHLRAELSDDSYASSDEEEDCSPKAQRSRSTSAFGPPLQDDFIALGSQTNANAITSATQPEDSSSIQQTSANLTPAQSPSLTEEQLVHKAAQLRATRPRRGGVFRDLSSPALSIVTSISGKTGSRLGSVATSVTSGRNSSNAFACTWNGCSKVFTRKSTLSIHVRTAHLGERPFECADCGRRFAHKHLVSRHRRVCTGVRSSPEQAANAGSRLRFSTSTEHTSGGDETPSDPDDWSQAEDELETAIVSEAASGQEFEEASPIAGSTEQLTSIMKPRLLHLLTGQGYSSTEVTLSKRAASTDEGNSTKRKRTTRDRVFACPWTSIRYELDQQMLDPELQQTSSIGAQQPAEQGWAGPACDHRFKRLYDLRRHLKSQHGLDLTPEELSAITTQTSWTSVH